MTREVLKQQIVDLLMSNPNTSADEDADSILDIVLHSIPGLSAVIAGEVTVETASADDIRNAYRTASSYARKP